MAFTLEHVEQVRNGFPREVGQIPDDVMRELEWPCPWVYLGKTGLEHIASTHPDITDFELLHLPMAILSGMMVRVKKDRRQLILGYKVPTEDRRYQAALKSAQSGTEVWVDSFYRIKLKRYRQLERQGDVLRSHK